jgi:hypothetical protein
MYTHLHGSSQPGPLGDPGFWFDRYHQHLINIHDSSFTVARYSSRLHLDHNASLVVGTAVATLLVGPLV